MDHLRVVLEFLHENQLLTNYSKCEFLLRSVAFHGHIISSEVVEFNTRKIEAVKNWPSPLAATDNRIFMCLVGYYRGLWGVLRLLNLP